MPIFESLDRLLEEEPERFFRHLADGDIAINERGVLEIDFVLYQELTNTTK